MRKIALCYQDALSAQRFAHLAASLELPELSMEEAKADGCTHAFIVNADGLSLEALKDSKDKSAATRVDFLDASLQYRLKTSGKSKGLGKALGLQKFDNVSVLDATTGFGKDALLMASLGCQVTMLERSALIYALLQDGFDRVNASQQDNEEPELARLIARMDLHHAEARTWCKGIIAGDYERPDVIYLDPMFPPRSKSAKVKKDIALLHEVLGSETDFASLLDLALQSARKRVVVKQPGSKVANSELSPSFIVPGKTAHFEVWSLI